MLHDKVKSRQAYLVERETEIGSSCSIYIPPDRKFNSKSY